MNKYIVALGSWFNDAIWSTTSGGAPNTTAPTIDDTVIYDANSPSGFVLDQDATVGGLINESSDANGFLVSTQQTLNVGNNGEGVFYWAPNTVRENLRLLLNLSCADVYLCSAGFGLTTVTFLTDCDLRLGSLLGPFIINSDATVVYRSTPLPYNSSWRILGGSSPYFGNNGGAYRVFGTLDLTEASHWSSVFTFGFPSLNVEGRLLNRDPNKVISLNLGVVFSANITKLDGRFTCALIFRTSNGVDPSAFSGDLRALESLTITGSTTASAKLATLDTSNLISLPSTTINAVFPFSWTTASTIPIDCLGDLISTGESITATNVQLRLVSNTTQALDFANVSNISVSADKTAGIVSNAVGSTFVIYDDSTCENIANSGTIEVPESTKLTTRYTAVGAATLSGTGTIRTDRSPTRALA